MGVGIKPPIATDIDHGNENFSCTAGKRRVRMPIVPCTIADHFALGSFLGEIFGSAYPAANPFDAKNWQASLDDPSYSPSNRLLLCRAGRIIAHTQVTRRIMQFGSLSLPAAGLQGLAIAANCCGQGLGTHLLLAAEKRMAQLGALVGLLRTRVPHFFRRTGWALCGGSAGASANPHAVLARLLPDSGRAGGLCRHRASRIQVRPWRRWEEEAVARVYRERLPSGYGMLERSRACWHWLLERRAYDQFYVALDGPDLFDLKESSTRLVGYAAIKGDKIVELLTLRERQKAAMELLARACGDAIEQDHRRISLHVPAGNPMLAYFRGAQPLSPVDSGIPDWTYPQSEYCMARLLDPLGLLRMLSGVFAERAKSVGLARPLELGLFVEGRKYQIAVLSDDKLGAGSVRVSAGTVARSYLRLNVADFTRLLLGQLDWERALEEGRVAPSTGLAREAGRALFPPLPFWRPMLDDLRG